MMSALRNTLAFLLVCAIGVAACGRSTQPPLYSAPDGSTVTLFPAKASEGPRRVLTVEAATDVSFMRPFIADFQRMHPGLTVRYVDLISSALFTHASEACRLRKRTADLYLTVATDHLVRLANDGCAAKLPSRLARSVPPWAQWRRNVVAFSLEPGVFVYNRRLLPDPPRDHIELIERLRDDTADWRGRIGTYDIRQAGSGYVYASFDARQSATYGRLIESFGRSRVRTYCCSNEMVDAVRRGEIMFAYNVQKSYAFAGRAKDSIIEVVTPADYQAVQTRSVMVTRNGGNRRDATYFAEYLVSERGQSVAAAQLSPLRDLDVSAGAAPRMVSPVSVGPVLLGLGDQARRNRFIQEWVSAIDPPRHGAGERSATPTG